MCHDRKDWASLRLGLIWMKVEENDKVGAHLVGIRSCSNRGATVPGSGAVEGPHHSIPYSQPAWPGEWSASRSVCKRGITLQKPRRARAAWRCRDDHRMLRSVDPSGQEDLLHLPASSFLLCRLRVVSHSSPCRPHLGRRAAPGASPVSRRRAVSSIIIGDAAQRQTG
jgi:hypothetical protein